MKKQKENILPYNSQQELFASLRRKQPLSFIDLSRYEWRMMVTKTIRILVAFIFI